MDFATGALGFLLPKLAQLLKDEYNLQKGARKDIEFLSRELEIMHAALCKVGKVPREQLSELQRIWARDVRELSYDMEDIVDTFMVDVEGPAPPSKSRAKKILKGMIRKVTKAMNRRGIAQDIKDIKERVKEMAEQHSRYKFDTITPAQTHIDPRLKAQHTEVTELVGIDEAKQEVIMRLTKGDDGNQRQRIVSIVGFGGLGKTTLAKAIYDEIKGEFNCTAFVSVSSNPDTDKLLRNMLYDLDKKKFKDDIQNTILDETHLINLVREFLRNKRYLIVIDDIWDTELWDNVIGLALIKNNMGSIITTTRKIDVAKHVGGCYKLKQLSDESSKILFYERIFGSRDDKWPIQFSEVSKKILKKCGGVPLAIVTISSLLANKSENIEEWDNVCDSIGLGLGNNPGMDSMRKILMLSYYDLPSHLKTCLLYLSIFPEDYVITKDRLIWMWVAEGFVHDPQGSQSFLEIGESYFNGLLNRSLIQPANMDVEGTPQACRVHDTVLDLIVSLSKEECFVSTVIGDGKHRRLSLHNTASWPTMKMAKLRSLIILNPNDVVIDPMPSLSCHLLRVLDLRGCRLKDFACLGFLVSLCHLRYLGLSRNASKIGAHINGFRRINHLPEEIGKLQFLQTLDLSRATVRVLPSSIIGLRQLRCLRGSGTKISNDRTRLPDAGLKNLASLEVLEGVQVTYKCIIAKELEYLTQLRVLEAKLDLPGRTDSGDDVGDRRTCAKPLVDSLGKLSKIESIDIPYNARGRLCFDGSVERLGKLRKLHMDLATEVPTWINGASLPVLSYLYLEVVHERREDIQVLGTLPSLRHLKLSVLFSNEQPELERCEVGPDAFPCVVRCHLRTQRVVPSMFPPGAMRRLQDFTFYTEVDYFRSGGRLTVDDLGLAHLPSLRIVTVGGLHDEWYDEGSEGLAVARSLREKLEQEAVIHPNKPRINFPRSLY
ncbi:unnamed protein product [Urochloa decumbens]|uniref:Uncharacterized protein n=1 Tax=Urochloa decumbens TaxID=240449 RepID=A0ABC9DZN2_9POAL